ncbi:protein MAINTENANCE OF MERISTEMS-like [Malania oleifera]|uniref:protein MAINTENANCE OF MERISTEMS-like n=1 Tax=Malania oleifera TaxID=397392 RepID=UPI0025AE2F2C|nr:protein MAINTENANCE OF MERISTEMS-like [Malania oleifera]
MAEPQEEDYITEERDELMISPSGDSTPTQRTAHFLKPSLPSSTTVSLLQLPVLISPSSTPFIELKKSVFFRGRVCPQRQWRSWVERLSPVHHSLWKKSGIYEAIMGSVHQILRDNELVFGVAERWCSETNTFIFPWGEATITLEDVMVLGGFSVLGDSVLSPLQTRELLEIEENLIRARKVFPSQRAWTDHFMASGDKLEHEAFLCLWLLRFVFPSNSYGTIQKHVFPIAVHLSRGTQIALAPAVLASIYRDLSLLKAKIDVELRSMKTCEAKDDCLTLSLWAPFQLVQLWAWERFLALQPAPNLIKQGAPRSAQWHKVGKLGFKNVRSAIDAASECFKWRPYAVAVNNWACHKFYGDGTGKQVVGDSDTDIELQSFARCVRTCELVGLDCIEKYLPHRVAMQFGMDQDVPDCVPRLNQSPELAWGSYNKLVRGGKLHMPHRLFESDVTMRYFDWWTQSVLAQKDPIKGVVRRPRSSRKLRRLSKICSGNKEAGAGSVDKD